MRLPSLFQPRVLKVAIKSLFSRPFTTSFPAKPFTPNASFRGRPRYSKDDCIGCGACAQVCPSKCIDVIDDLSSRPAQRRLVQHMDQCIQCGQCERYCTTEKGIKLISSDYLYLGFCRADFEEKVEKELLVCGGCGELIGPVDQIKWLAKRLGPLAFTNPTLMLVSLKELAVVDQGVQGPANTARRADRISVQCPKCRRKTALAM